MRRLIVARIPRWCKKPRLSDSHHPKENMLNSGFAVRVDHSKIERNREER